jgi:hypothetical protein
VSTVEIVSLIVRMARAFGWHVKLMTTSYTEIMRDDVVPSDRLAFIVNNDGTITVSIGHVGTNFVPIEPLGVIGLLS